MTGIIKTTLKLLFRNIIFWVFLIAMPVLSTLMLRLQAENFGSRDAAERKEVIDIEFHDLISFDMDQTFNYTVII